jgi:hypothetical protein
MKEARVRVLSIEPKSNFTENSEGFDVTVTVRISADNQHIDLESYSQGRSTLNSAVSSALADTVQWAERLLASAKAAQSAGPQH